ncbi:VanZ family protein [Paenibacillus koleovorans]|uniref:VanZ family protein n=1 Tax=Paenibacillus koleovorans TaxID=121608 RepID=UPI000FD8B0B3|nr:VanZ family protein [Paenibacillus koleovorans]
MKRSSAVRTTRPPRRYRWRAFWMLLSLIYAVFMFKLLFVRPHQHLLEDAPYRYNLIPFQTISNYITNYAYFNFETWFKNLFGNIVLFIPIGWFVPVWIRATSRFFPFFFVSLALLLLVETAQLATKLGSFDVDDLILNMVGAIIGFVWSAQSRKL